MDYSLTVFKSKFDNKTHRKVTLDSESFDNLFMGLSTIPKKGKTDAELISPAVYQTGTTRANKNVLAWAGWCAVDIDDIDVGSRDLREVIDGFVPLWGYICYSTASSRADKPKFRLVFKLDEHIEADNIRHFWYALQTELGNVGDRQCKDLSRMYYVPGEYADAHNFFFTREGPAINVAELLAKHEYVDKVRHGTSFLERVPPEMAKQIINYRKKQAEGKAVNVSWTSYHDCPFFPKKMAAEYQVISETGWYHKMYQIMVAIASRAIEKEYPITAREIAIMCKQLDDDTGGWYGNRPLEVEADRAIEYAYTNI
jgi:hypothetical protein